jgi:hypothetical protein
VLRRLHLGHLHRHLRVSELPTKEAAGGETINAPGHAASRRQSFRRNLLNAQASSNRIDGASFQTGVVEQDGNAGSRATQRRTSRREAAKTQGRKQEETRPVTAFANLVLDQAHKPRN